MIGDNPLWWKMITKLLLGLVAMCLLVMIGTGCAVKTKPSTAQMKDVPDPVEIKFLHWRVEDKEALGEVIAMFEKEHPTIRVRMEVIPTENYTVALQTRLISGEGVADVYYMHPGQEFDLSVRQGELADLTGEELVGNYDEQYLAIGQSLGKQLAVPYSANIIAVVYNKALFKSLQLSVPHTWDELLASCEAAKQAGIIPIVNGGQDGWPIMLGYINPVTSQITGLSDPSTFNDKFNKGQIKMSDPVFQSVLSAYKTLVDLGYYPKSNLATKYDQSVNLFAQNKALYLMTGTWAMTDIRKQNDNADFGLMYLPFPTGPTKGVTSVGMVIGIDAKSKHKAESKLFLDFLSRPEIATIIGDKTGQMILLKDIMLKSPDMQMVYKLDRFADLPIDKGITIPWTYVFSAMITEIASGQSLDKATEDGQKILDALLIEKEKEKK